MENSNDGIDKRIQLAEAEIAEYRSRIREYTVDKLERNALSHLRMLNGKLENLIVERARIQDAARPPNFEEQHPTDILQLIPKDGVRCGDGQRLGDWSPCGGYAKTIAKKKECNMYECPYHKWDPADHWG